MTRIIPSPVLRPSAAGSVADGATEVKSDITIEGKVTINATGGGDVAIGDSTNGETQFSGLQVGTTITRRNGKGDDVSQPGDVVREQAPTETEAAEAPSTGSVEVEPPVHGGGAVCHQRSGQADHPHLHPERARP